LNERKPKIAERRKDGRGNLKNAHKKLGVTRKGGDNRVR